MVAGILEGIWHLTASHNDESGEMPFSEAELLGWMEIEQHGLLEALLKWRWLDEVDGKLFVHDWEEHRPKYVNDRIRKRNYGKSAKVAEGSGKSRKVAEHLPTAPHSDSPSDSPSDSDYKKEQSSASASDFASSALKESKHPPAEEPLSEFAFVQNNGKVFQLTIRDVDRYVKAFPYLDVEQELRTAEAYFDTTPEKRKTSPRGYRSCLTKWMARSQDKRGGNGVANNEKVPLSKLGAKR